MGLLIDGQWHDQWYDTAKSGGRFERWESAFRNWVTADGAAGPSGEGGFKAEPDRYRLYVADTCPWAHRTRIYRRLKGLDDAIALTKVATALGSEGWSFANTEEDPEIGAGHLHEIYTAAAKDFTGRVTVPVLWDRRQQTIVSNESSEIIRMLNSAFDGAGASGPDLYPADLREEIDALNAVIYENVNNGVYRCGFATSQEAYDEAFDALFATLDELEARLARQRYLVGDRPTEADWRLFPTLVRFDVAYYGNFKCNKRRLVEYPNLWAYARELYQMPGIAETLDLAKIKRGYYGIRQVNPTGIVPKGPEVDFTEPHGRDKLRAA